MFLKNNSKLDTHRVNWLDQVNDTFLKVPNSIYRLKVSVTTRIRGRSGFDVGYKAKGACREGMIIS